MAKWTRDTWAGIRGRLDTLSREAEEWSREVEECVKVWPVSCKCMDAGHYVRDCDECMTQEAWRKWRAELAAERARRPPIYCWCRGYGCRYCEEEPKATPSHCAYGDEEPTACEDCDGTGCPCLRWRDWQSMDLGCECGCRACGVGVSG